MAIKDLRNLNEAKIKLSEAKELLENDGYSVVKGDVEIDESSAVALVKEAGYTVIAESEIVSVEEAMKVKVIEALKEDGDLLISESEIESVEEAMEAKIVEKLKEDGVTMLDEEMMDAIDEELEAMVTERVEAGIDALVEGVEDLEEGELPPALKAAIAKKKAKDGDKDADKDADKKDEGDDDKDADDKDGKDGEDGEEKVAVKKEQKEAFLEGLIGGNVESVERKTGSVSLLESLID